MNRYSKLSIILVVIFIIVTCVFTLTKDTKYEMKNSTSIGLSILISCLIMIIYVVYFDREDTTSIIDTGLGKQHVLLGEMQPKYYPEN